MAVAAATDCLRGIDRATVDGVLFASTSYPYKEKQGAASSPRRSTCAATCVTADFGGSLRAGTTALRAALDAVKAGSAQQRPGRGRRLPPGRAALGARAQRRRRRRRVPDRRRRRRRDGRARSTRIADEIIDVWRTDGDPFVHTWEDRFVVEHGYRDSVVEVGEGPAREARPERRRTSPRRALYGPDARSHAGAGARARLRSQDAGAGPAVRQARQHRRRLRADAAGRRARERQGRATRCCWPATATAPTRSRCAVGDRDRAAQRPARRALAPRAPRRARRLRQVPALPAPASATEHDRRAGAGVSATMHFRDRDEDISFHGQRCRKCGPGAVPAPARLLHLLRARRVRPGAPRPTAPARCCRSPSTSSPAARPAAGRHDDRGRGRRARLPADDRRQRPRR